ncbi:hypothetical protein AAG570_005564 [Ranatra chinensis]|uniref:Uncharacterized protein n=1 Tax=Ranatra chinensis TaxID=642074 RepID=A0ABD0YJJ7_9HEMI
MDLQREVRELEESNRDDSLAITELQREYLSWDKKYQLAVETKENIEKERAVYGEIGLMKQEIHRMEVRYAHLRKAQEKLIQDLEMCVARRDGIVDVAFAREMRASKGEVSYTRHQFIKKIDELKNKLKKSMQNVKDAEKQIEELRSEKKQLTENYETKQEQLDALKSGINQLENQLFEGQIHKHKVTVIFLCFVLLTNEQHAFPVLLYYWEGYD